MTSFWSRLKSLLAGEDGEAPPLDRVEPEVASPRPGLPAEAADDAHWQAVYGARQAWYEQAFGLFPSDILKMKNLTGVWPGGGLFALPADRVEPGLWLYTTFGLSNPGMPARVVSRDVQIAPDGSFSGTLQAKAPESIVVPPPGAAGYGYEFALVVRDSVQWPLWVLQWAASAELLQDVNLLDRVDKHEGLTVQEIAIDDGRHVNLLIAKARAPLPQGTTLPNGRMDLLVATVITEDEMRWSMQHGRGALLERLMARGVGQVSALGRASVV
ncbi:MAG TPA: suppressor of fused domain protein [Burkholderiaceae bacterium]